MSHIPITLIPITLNIAIETISWSWWSIKTTFDIGKWLIYGTEKNETQYLHDENKEQQLEIDLLQRRLEELSQDTDYVFI